MQALHAHARIKRSAVVTLLCLGAGLAILLYQQRYALSWLGVDHAAIRDWWQGEGLYAYRSPDHRVGTALSPVAALLLAPAARLPLPVTGWLLALAGLAALVLGLVALAGPVARRYGKPRGRTVLVAAALALLTEPVRSTLGLGALDLLLFALVTADVVALRRSAWARSRAAWWPGPPASQPVRSSASALRRGWADRSPVAVLRRGWATGTWAGVGIGIATALAVSPAIFLLYLMVSRQWRAALIALGTTATLLTGAALIAPGTTAAWFGSVLPQIDRSGPPDAPANQSLAGVLDRLYDTAGTPVLIWLSFAVLLLAVGLIRARSAHADGDEIAAFTLVGLTAAAIGPVSRIHELIWILPAVLILVDAAARQRFPARRPLRPRRVPGAGYAVAAALIYLLLVLDPIWTAGWNGYAFVLILLLNVLPWRPGVASAIPVRRGPAPARRTPAIPGPRGS
ncbi:glycosyltransferase 87 family protein [Paractinoplanes rishiriensis]|uniref:Alpha-1,2-mannosyltransferase n=1 Tax=Paractinoplanes rishiriensis TaxID=1050105 RepID=A0A919MV59_9ACTN|nr:glycosyltransferase 87 family protein [Actinoplanes rishiriensis]GIE96488.1 hypothetical protein Ari01nite_39530 [Actinoplanes rishiriensis]